MPHREDPPPPAGPACAPGAVYLISIRGRLGDALCAAFAPLHVTTAPGRTLLQGVLEDQAALYGVLARIQALGLDLEEVRLLASVPGPPDGR